jgi:hypothetical protein
VNVGTGIGVAPTYEDQQYGVTAITFTQRKNTKKI